MDVAAKVSSAVLARTPEVLSLAGSVAADRRSATWDDVLRTGRAARHG